MDTIYTPHTPTVRCTDCHTTNTEQVVWKYPTLKPGCGGCHGPQFMPSFQHKARGPGSIAPRPQ